MTARRAEAGADPVPEERPGATVAVVADRVGWEERRLLDALGATGLDGRWVNDEALSLGLPKSSPPSCALALIRSRSYVRGRLLATALTASGVPTLNSPRTIALCENKLDLLTTLHRTSVPAPAFRLVLSRADLRAALAEFGTPTVVKPLYGGRGRRVFLLRDRDLAESFYDYVEDLAHGYEQAYLAEPFLEGPTLRCLVAGERVVATVRFGRPPGEWRRNAATGGDPHHLTDRPDAEDVALRAAAALGPGVYGVDLFDQRDGPLVGEVNHVPGFRTLAAVAPVDPARALAAYIRRVLG
ncbi:RimK family alpha-L-glutamate ligase [Streptomyces sp. NPDC053474]|uniref:RimK family alpha-L-glutamate ligase n=1 Tax=Streptomyces sp. NPDC053474 TaxID=3365704 RepID=UPI0037CDFAE1